MTEFEDPPRRGGGRSDGVWFGAETRAEIVRRTAEGESMRAICVDPAMPGLATVSHWAASEPAFALAMAEARTAAGRGRFGRVSSYDEPTAGGQLRLGSPSASRHASAPSSSLSH